MYYVTQSHDQSLLEAERRSMIQSEEKNEEYSTWIKIMKSLKKIAFCEKDSARYYRPVVVVPKPNGAVRVTHDFSGLKIHTPLYKFNQESIEGIWKWASSSAY
eukprot:GHVP01048078.1.p1 GENE.GHVP01048078.1~~GHVP01048078.1.p1  ORF type:complete len:103 (-),score=13.75 GHVP01048078.1:450-758(-)